MVITPLHKKGALSNPKNYRMLAINRCVYRLFSNVVRDLLTEWALAEHQIPDTQFGLYYKKYQSASLHHSTRSYMC